MTGPQRLALVGLLALPTILALRSCYQSAGTAGARAYSESILPPPGLRDIPTEEELRKAPPGEILPASSLKDCLADVEARRARKPTKGKRRPVPEPGDCFHSPDPRKDRE